jgi:hypothetical protein
VKKEIGFKRTDLTVFGSVIQKYPSPLFCEGCICATHGVLCQAPEFERSEFDVGSEILMSK